MVDRSKSGSILTKKPLQLSRCLITSYVVDWILIIATAVIGLIFNKTKHSNHRPFSLQDSSISYPYVSNTVSSAILIVVGLIAPAAITLVVSLLLVPGPTAAKSTPKALIWRRKLWEWNTAWMGLALALATAFAVTEGLKDLAGKPRPYALSVCRPDLNTESIARHRVGGLGQTLDTTGATPILVSYEICQETNVHVLRNAFASWPSGHSSFSCAGLVYLSLFLCAKLAVGLPFVGLTSKQDTVINTFAEPIELDSPAPYPPRNQAAAPPIYLIILAVYVPIGTAIFVCVSRWFDFHHHGIDVLSGAVIGAVSAFLSFRLYHMPVRRGTGWSWGTRSRSRAFWLGVGRNGYVGDEDRKNQNFAMTRSDHEVKEDDRGPPAANFPRTFVQEQAETSQNRTVAA